MNRVTLWADPIPWECGHMCTVLTRHCRPIWHSCSYWLLQPFYQATFISNQSAGYNLTTSQTDALTWLPPSTSVARQLLGGGPHSMARELPSNFAITPMHFLGVLCTGTCTGRSQQSSTLFFFLDPPVSSPPDNPPRVLASSFEVSKFVPINRLLLSIHTVNVSLRASPACNSSLTTATYPGNPYSCIL